MTQQKGALTGRGLSRAVNKDKQLTARRLLTGNDWVIDHPILLPIVNESISATQANNRVTEQFAGLPAVNNIASAVRKLVVLRLQGNKKGSWETLSKRDDDWQPADMFTFPPKTSMGKVSFSLGMDFYPPREGGIVSHDKLPPLLREITNGLDTSISSLSGTAYELPIIVDVDGDFHSEIVMGINNYSLCR